MGQCMALLAMALVLGVGVSLGLLGGGGSILMVPILRYALGQDAHTAITLSLLVVGTTSLAAVVPHARAGRVRWKTAFVFGLAGMAGAYPAGALAGRIPPAVLLVSFALVMIVTAAAMLRRKPGGRGDPSQPAKARSIAKIVAEGVVVGAVTGFIGAGGGFLVVPALVLLGGLPMEVAVGTSLVVIALKSLAAFAGFVGHTTVPWALALAVSAAAIVGTLAGSQIAGRVCPKRLQAGFGWFVVAMAAFMLAQELPPWLGLAASLPRSLAVAALATASAAVAVSLWRRRPAPEGRDLKRGRSGERTARA